MSVWAVLGLEPEFGRTALGFGLIALGALACEGSLAPTAPSDPVSPRVTCELPSWLMAGNRPEPLGLDPLLSALQHAAGPMSSALGTSEPASRLARAIEAMAAREGLLAVEPSCKPMLEAAEALQALPDDPETRPDRDGIGLVLTLAAALMRVTEANPE